MQNMDTDIIPGSSPARAVAALRRFTRPRANADAAEERCDLCAAPLAHAHQHLLEPAARQVICACDACAVLFSTREGTKYRRVPRQIERWTDFSLSDEQWAGLGVPIALAFFARSSRKEMIATYPSPGGPTESAIPVEAWDGLLQANAVLGELEPDVEALLINRVNGARDAFRAPIDECYKLVGLIRLHWRGFSGGSVVWEQIDAFFKDLTTRADARSVHA